MTDLISRADVIDAVCRTRCGDKAKGCPAHSCLVIEEFDALPSAEAVHGEWIKRGTKITCSHCKSAWSASFDTIIVGMKYCPYCGAKMGGDDE